jgi:transposase-like protein
MLQTDLYSFSYKKGSLVPFCKRCGAQHFYKNGTNKLGIQRYRCRVCNFRFVWTSDLPRRNFFSSIMTFAVEIYTTLRIAISLRGITQVLKKDFNVKVSHEAVRQWILVSSKEIPRREFQPSTNWHADETYIKIQGIGYWLWVVYCRDTKCVLSWHISENHLLRHARKVMEDAYKVTGTVPKTITTDGLWQYPVAIYKTMKWNWKEQRKKHIIDSGIGKNAVIERLNREIKRRIKFFSTFQALKSARIFFSLWFYHYNQIKSSHST